MKSEEMEKLMDACNFLMEERQNVVFKTVSKTQRYKERTTKLTEMRNKLTEKLSETEIEQFEHLMYNVNEVENNYLYMQGFVDGILLRENLYETNKINRKNQKK